MTTQRSHSEGEFIDPPPGTLLNQPPYLPGVPPPQYSHLVPPAGGGSGGGIAAAAATAPLRTSKSAGEITFNGGSGAAGAGGYEPGDVAHFGAYEPTVPKRKGKSRQRRDDLVSPGRTCSG